MMQAGTLAVALMAGGQSTRMGRDKARLLDREGRELWHGRLELLRQLGAEEVLISCRKDQRYLAEGGERLVLDHWENAGPLGGVVGCLENMDAERLLVLAVDLPGMTREALETLIAATGQGGAVFCYGGCLEPLAAVYPKSMATSGRRRLEAGEFSLQGWILEAGETMRVLEAAQAAAGLFVNVNDPAAWGRWMAGEE